MTDRREFVQTMGALALGCFVQPPGPRPRAPGPKLDRIGLQLYTVRGEMQRDFEGTLKRVAETGYKEVEFAGYFGRRPADVRALLDRHGLTAPAAHVGSLAPEPWREALEAAQTIGHRYLVVPWIPAERRRTLDDYKLVAADFNRVAAEARAAGIQFAYHNHDFEFVPLEGRIPFDVLLAETDARLVQLEIDLYWITKAGRDPLAYFARHAGRVPLVHVKDSAGPPAHRMVEVGAGTIDFAKLFAHRAQAGIRHFFVEHDEPGDAFASIAASYEYLKRLEF